MKRALLIDDEPLAIAIVREYLSVHEDIEVIEECNNGFEGLKAIEALKPDLVFLDIQMPKINGFEMLELVDQEIAVIFTTAYDEYAIKAFETSAIDYLLKPFTQERFNKAIEKWKKNTVNTTQEVNELTHKQPNEGARIIVKEQGNIKIIPTPEVLYIEAYDDYVKIHTKEQYFLKKKTMNYYENVLINRDFIRIHRSYIINLNALTRVESFEKNSYRATLTNGSQIPISRSTYPLLKKSLGM